MNVTKTLDCKGIACPLPIVQISKAMRELEPGEILEVEATDPAFIADVEAWSRKTGNRLIGTESGDVQRAVLEKA